MPQMVILIPDKRKQLQKLQLKKIKVDIGTNIKNIRVLIKINSLKIFYYENMYFFLLVILHSFNYFFSRIKKILQSIKHKKLLYINLKRLPSVCYRGQSFLMIKIYTQLLANILKDIVINSL